MLDFLKQLIVSKNSKQAMRRLSAAIAILFGATYIVAEVYGDASDTPAVFDWLIIGCFLGILLFAVQYIRLQQRERQKLTQLYHQTVDAISGLSFADLKQPESSLGRKRKTILIALACIAPVTALVLVAIFIDVNPGTPSPNTSSDSLLNAMMIAVFLFIGVIFAVAWRQNSKSKDHLADFARVNDFELVRRPSLASVRSCVSDGAYESWSFKNVYFMLSGEYKGTNFTMIAAEMVRGVRGISRQFEMLGFIVVDTPIVGVKEMQAGLGGRIVSHPEIPEKTLMIIKGGIPHDAEGMSELFRQIDGAIGSAIGQ